MNKPTNLEEYLQQVPDASKPLLRALRALIKSIVPEAEETLSYGIGGFKFNNSFFIYYSGNKQHIGLYPVPRTYKDFEQALQSFKGGKSTLQLPLDRPHFP